LLSRELTWIAGVVLIALGIVCLYLSDGIVTGWWQGTLEAFGVGFIVGGLVDVLALSGLIGARERQRADAVGDKRAQVTFQDAEATLRVLVQLQKHLAAQDVLLSRIVEKIDLNPPPVTDAPPDELTRYGDETTSDDETTEESPGT
jgi:hypothetical protein